MPRHKTPNIQAAIRLAKKLFKDAKANGTLKPGRGLAAVALSNGLTHSVRMTVTWQDYLPDAQKILTFRH